MKNLWIAVCVVAGLAGCGKSGGKSDPVSKMKAFSDQMCACKKDKDPVSCSVKVNVSMKQWEDSLDEKSIDKDMEAKLEEADNAFGQCRREINGD